MRCFIRQSTVRACWLTLLVGCGARSSLDLQVGSFSSAGAGALARGGASGDHSISGGPSGSAGTDGPGKGGTASAGASTEGTAAAGGSDAGANTGGANTGGVNTAGGGTGGSAGMAPCTQPKLVRVTPPNAKTNVLAASGVSAKFSCPPAAQISRPASMSLTGKFAGELRAAFPPPAVPNEVWLTASAPDGVRNNPYFAGEVLTARLGSALGGPYLWQFTAAVRAKATPTFSDTGQALSPAQDAELADLDADGDLDLVTGSSKDQLGRVYANDGKGNFSLAASLAGLNKPFLVDLDRDGQLDIVSDRVFMAAGLFKYEQAMAFGEVHAVFDADGDGDFDVFQVGDEQQWALLRNDGARRFTPVLMAKSYVFDAQVGDLDNDGDLDLVAIALVLGTPDAYRGAVLLNDGTGHFTEIEGGLLVNATRSLALGDVDSDGDLDVLMGSWGAAGAINPPNQVWLNNGHARFSAGATALAGSAHVLLSDLDGDGDLDAIAGQHPPYSTLPGLPSQVLINDGKGNLSSSGSVGGSNFQRVVLGDLDGDGDSDAVVAQWDWSHSPPVQVWLQDG